MSNTHKYSPNSHKYMHTYLLITEECQQWWIVLNGSWSLGCHAEVSLIGSCHVGGVICGFIHGVQRSENEQLKHARVTENQSYGSYPNNEGRKRKLLFPPGIEPGTFRVLGGCDNHYTTETATLRRPTVPSNTPGPLSKALPCSFAAILLVNALTFQSS